jgi:transposase InsO family protein
MWAHLQRQGVPVARCTVERIMRANGWRGAMRARWVRTTVADPAAARAPDLVRRRFRSARPDALHVADFTYVPLHGAGFGYTAFVIDAYAGLIVGWECSLTKNTAFVERAIRAAAARRAREGHPLSGDTIHHSDAGSQYTATYFTETLMLAGLTPSTTPWPRQPLGSTRPNASATDPRSATGRCARWPTSRTPPPRGCTGTTPTDSCTAWADAHRQKPRPSNTLTTRSGSTPITRNEVCMKPGVLQWIES